MFSRSSLLSCYRDSEENKSGRNEHKSGEISLRKGAFDFMKYAVYSIENSAFPNLGRAAVHF